MTSTVGVGADSAIVKTEFRAANPAAVLVKQINAASASAYLASISRFNRDYRPMPIEDAEGGGTLQYWVDERNLSGTGDVRTVNVSLLEVRNRHNGIVYTILSKMGGGVVRTTARRDFLEFGTRVTIHQPIDVRSVHVSTGFAPNINEVHMVDAEGNAVQQINRIRITKWEEKWPRYISPYKDRRGVEITSLFGYRILNGRTQFHAGWDFATGRGTPLYSIADGDVIANVTGNGFGHYVVIKYKDPVIGDFCALYGHMNEKSALKVDDEIKQGDLVGYEGDSDTPGSIHLHFQTWRGTQVNFRPPVGVVINPLEDLYGLEMNQESINGSGLFKLRDVRTNYRGERLFLTTHPNGTGDLTDTKIINDKRTILDLLEE
ncbi:MAG: M23 family metallopeptidase [Defluviitaleaceae bacterium]|nr:M23 family metallopeptidase [Defluviitaleaceae bacterium]